MPGKVFLDLGGGRGKRRAVAVAIALGVAATGVEAKQAGEEAVEPGRWAGENGALSGSTGTVIEPQPGKVFDGANMSLSCSVEYRLVNSWNDSWGPGRADR